MIPDILNKSNWQQGEWNDSTYDLALYLDKWSELVFLDPHKLLQFKYDVPEIIFLN